MASSASDNPVRRCSQCDIDWPALPAYNLCPKCQRCTWASTADEKPNLNEARQVADKYAAFNKYLEKNPGPIDVIMAGLEEAFAATPSIPDPPEHAQDVRYHRWEGDDA